MSETELEQGKRLALNIRERIENATPEERIQILDELFNKWVVKDFESENVLDYLQIALTNFGLTVNNLQLGTFEKSKKILVYELSYLQLFFTQEDDLEDEDRTLVIQKCSKIFKAIIDAENAIRSALYLQGSMTEKEIGDENNPDIMRYTPMDYSNNTSYQNLLLYLLEQLMRKGYRRYKDDKEDSKEAACYQRIYTEDGYDTHAWEKSMSLREFVYDNCRKEINFLMWQNLTAAKDNAKAAALYLSEQLGCEFEDIKRDRHVFSFKNGIYITKIWSEEKEFWTDKWIPYDSSQKIGASVVSCKYFNLEFDETTRNYEDWWDIIENHCKNFNHIMNYQEWPDEVRKWLCILIGRMLYNLGDLDDWQIIPYLLGLAASGKSTVLTKIVKKIYENCDVGVLSNNMEKKFGLGALSDKFMYIGPEIKGDLAMEQSEFQSIISGEDVQVAKKHKSAETVLWKVPGILAGNEVPQYTDNAGSISRRLLVFKFDKNVKKGDTKLGDKLSKEMPYIIHACNIAYLEAVEQYDDRGIWDIVPPYFKASKEEMAENTNALMHFLKSDKVKLDSPERKNLKESKVYIREREFLTAFNDHCKEAHLGKFKWNPQYYTGPFEALGIKMIKSTRKKYPPVTGRYFNGNFIVGVDVIAEFDMSQEGYEDVEEDYEEVEEEEEEEEENQSTAAASLGNFSIRAKET